MTPNSVERRKMHRLRLEVLVRVKLPLSSSVIFGETRNVSAGGIYFVTRGDRLQEGQELDCVLILPEKLTMARAPILVAIHGKVMRINREAERTGVALEIYAYDFSGNGGHFPENTQLGDISTP